MMNATDLKIDPRHRNALRGKALDILGDASRRKVLLEALEEVIDDVKAIEDCDYDEWREYRSTAAFSLSRLVEMLQLVAPQPESPEAVIGAREAIAEVLPMIQRLIDHAHVNTYCRDNKQLTAQQVFDMAESSDSETITILVAVCARLRIAVPGDPAIKAADVPL